LIQSSNRWRGIVRLTTPVINKEKQYLSPGLQDDRDNQGSRREPEQLDLLLPPRQRERVETWRGQRIDDMTREEAIEVLKECATAYRDHLKDDEEIWERQRKWGYNPPRGRHFS
jgi:hypothetical protein